MGTRAQGYNLNFRFSFSWPNRKEARLLIIIIFTFFFLLSLKRKLKAMARACLGCAGLGEFQQGYCLSIGSLARLLTFLSLNVLIYKAGFKVAASEVSVKLNQVCIASGDHELPLPFPGTVSVTGSTFFPSSFVLKTDFVEKLLGGEHEVAVGIRCPFQMEGAGGPEGVPPKDLTHGTTCSSHFCCCGVRFVLFRSQSYTPLLHGCEEIKAET